MNLRQLRHVLAVAETLNFHRASEKVFLSQSALSRSVANFEKTIGLRIFERTNTSVTISHVGHQVIKLVKNIINEANYFEIEIKNLSTGSSGHVKFGLGPFLGNHIISGVMKEFYKKNPDVEIMLNINNWSNLQYQLEKEEIEFFIADIKEIRDDANLSIEILASPKIEFYCDENHSLYKKYKDNIIPPKELIKYNLISVAIPANVKEEIKNALGINTGKFKIHIECDDIILLKNMLPDSDLIMLSAVDAMPEHTQKNIRKLNTNINPNRLGIWGLVTLTNKQLSPAALKLAAALKNEIALTN